MFYSPTNATSVGRQSGLFSTGFSFTQNFPQLTSGRVPALILDNGVPTFTGTLPNTDPTLANGNVVEFMNPGAGKPGYMSSWTLNVQRELPGQFLLDLGYVGQRGVALPSGLENLNQVDLKYLSLGNTLNADINSDAARAAGITAPYPGFTGSVSQALRPYPQFTDIRNLYQPIGWSTYHAMQMRLQRRYSMGVDLPCCLHNLKGIVSGGGYTGSVMTLRVPVHSTRIIDSYEKRLAGFDTPQNLVLSWGYEMPFGKGKKFLGHAGTAANLLVGGWQINAIQRYVSGTPVGVSGGGVIPLSNGGNRPSRVLGVPARTNVSGSDFDPARDRYLDPNAFVQPAAFTLGNAPPVLADVRTFSFLNEDFSVLKDFPFYEAHRIQFRAEFFNIFNRVVFAGPSGISTLQPHSGESAVRLTRHAIFSSG